MNSSESAKKVIWHQASRAAILKKLFFFTKICMLITIFSHIYKKRKLGSLKPDIFWLILNVFTNKCIIKQRRRWEFHIGGSDCLVFYLGGSGYSIFSVFPIGSKILGGSADPPDPPLTTPLLNWKSPWNFWLMLKTPGANCVSWISP